MSVLSNMRIGKRLTLGFGVVMVLAVALGLLAVAKMRAAGTTAVDLDQHSMGALRYLTERTPIQQTNITPL